MAVPIRKGGGGKLRKKNLRLKFVDKVPTAIKLDGGGGEKP